PRILARSASIALAVLAVAVPAAAQTDLPPERGGFTTSMGIPDAWRFNAGILSGVHGGEVNEAAFYGTVGAYRDLLSPAIQAAGLLTELYGGRRGNFDQFDEGWDAGVRMGLFMPVTRLSFAADYSFVDDRLDFLLSLIHPLRRGGIFVDGGNFRVDWIPGRDHSLYFGVQLPVAQRFVGTTRPTRDRVHLPHAVLPEVPVLPRPSAPELVAHAHDLALWVTQLTVPFIDQYDSDQDAGMALFAADMREIAAFLDDPAGVGLDGPVTPEDVVEAYHAAWERAFSLAVADPDGPAETASTELGVRVWNHARKALLENVLYPYNGLLGLKKENDNVWGFGAAASAAFYEWLSTETPVPDDRLRDVAWTFSRLLAVVDSVRAYQNELWDDGRYVFLPLQLALRPEEHDTQGEIDAILEAAVREKLTPGNQVFYVENEQFQIELSRMILEARDYHVLWIHDYTGRSGGEPDPVALAQAVDSYMRALINAANAYDETGSMPQYIIILDQWFFQAKSGDLFLRLLQDPLHYALELGSDHRAMEERVAAAQEELRAAVANSALMQAQARMFEDGWIENLVKVHVNITNPADVSFWTDELLPLIGMPDMIARDHRKIAFYDLEEEDPYSGGAMLTGMGVGQEYTGARWDDRALMLVGPATLGLKYAARDLLLGQGLDPTEIPWSLRPRPLPEDYQDRIERAVDAIGLGGVAPSRVLGVHNQVGYRPKMVDVAKATLYTILPPGSVIKAPDSLWNLPLWCSMLFGNALRGGRSLLIAPALDHAPSAGFPQMSRAQELLARGVVLDQIFSRPLARSGGLFKVGLYNPPGTAGDTPSRMKALVHTLEETPWLRDLQGLTPETVAAIDALADDLIAEGFDRTYWVESEDTVPRLHLKAHFYATAEAWDGLLGRPEARSVLLAYYRAAAEQNSALAAGEPVSAATLTEAIIPPGRDLV
ncbi:MAG: hypothetical protein P8177_09740, partial [Gemmatimonadota bacterium]